MLLVADVGNTETTLGLAEGERIVEHWRVTTEAGRTPDEVHLLLHNLLAASGRSGVKLTGAAIGSVVPGVTTATATMSIPADDGGQSMLVKPEGSAAGGRDTLGVTAISTTAGLWDTLGLSLREGRTFTQAEVTDPASTVVLGRR